MAARPIREVIGEGARRVREAAGGRQDDVSRAARTCGLAWSRSKVAALERGDKAISPEELAVLPTILTEACGQPVTMADLIDADAEVRISDAAVMSGRTLLRVYASGKAADISAILLLGRDANATEESPVDDAAMRRLADLGLDADLRAWDGYFRSMGDPELDAARKLGEPPVVVGVLSFHLWMRPLSAERDARVSERADAGTDADRLRALRGRVTRQLVDQIGDEIRKRSEKAAANEDQG